MTDKKTSIIYTALELFANEGYNNTSTSKIAKQAGVSEGLIFRHFQNKQGLLDAIMQMTYERILKIYAPILDEVNPLHVIEKAIELPLEVDHSEKDFWRLLYKLKWERNYDHTFKMTPFLEKLIWAFRELKTESPEKEAQMLGQLLEHIFISMLRDDMVYTKEYKDFIFNKYSYLK